MRKHKKFSLKIAPPTTMDNLPHEVLSDIFTRLLAKQVAQMRCVSKSWNALLSHPSFIKSHLCRSLQKNDEVLLFSGLIFSFEFGPSPFKARLSCSPDLELANFIKFPAISEGRFGCGTLVGSVNGLICFSYAASFGEYVLHIWNPSLSSILSLPPCPMGLDMLDMGFGYDPESDDYKIMKLTTFYQAPNMEPQCEVYSMRKASWKLISHQSFPSRVTIVAGQNQVCVDGHLHWLCDSDLEGNPQMIVAFDVGAKTFSLIPLPEVVYKCSNVLGVLGGKLCLITRAIGAWEVWVMNEHGVPESWVKHHVFSQLSEDIVPYGFTSHGDFLFQVDQDQDHDTFGLYELHYGLYDPVAAKTKTFKIMTNSTESKVVEYVDSLAWVAPLRHKSGKVKRKRKTSLL